MKACGTQKDSDMEEVSQYLAVERYTKAIGKRTRLTSEGASSARVDGYTPGTCMTMRQMVMVFRSIAKEANMKVNGSMIICMVMVCIHTQKVEYTEVSSRMISVMVLEGLNTVMAAYTSASGWTISAQAMECEHGLMEDDTKGASYKMQKMEKES